MRMTSFEPFSTASITAALRRMRIDQHSLESAIGRTVADLAYKIPTMPLAAPAPDKAPARKVRRAVAKVAKVDPLQHPGPVPETWQDLTTEQRAWWRDRYSWHSTLFLTTLPRRSPAECYETVLRGEAWGRKMDRKRAKMPERVDIPSRVSAAHRAVIARLFDPGYMLAKYGRAFECRPGAHHSIARVRRIVAWRNRKLAMPPAIEDLTGYAYVLAGSDWAKVTNRHLVQRVNDDSPNFGPISRRILAAMKARDKKAAQTTLAA